MAKKPKPEGKKYNYMDTYGDLVTLLLCFFVLLFSMSTVEEVKYNAFVEALSNKFGATPLNLSQVPEDMIESGSDFGDQQPTGDMAQADPEMPADLAQLEQKISEYIEENNMQGEVSVERSESGATFIRMSNNLLFDGDSAVLKTETQNFLDFLAACFNEVERQILSAQFNGHTASIAGSGTDDWKLSADRIGEVSSYISNEGGFNRFKIKSSSFGRNYPIADNATPEGRAKNRRVDIVVLDKNSPDMELQLMEAMRVYFPSDDISFFEGAPTDLPDGVLSDIDPIGGGDEALAGLGQEELDALLNGDGAGGAVDPAAGDGPAFAGNTTPAGDDAPAFAGQP